MARLFGGKPFGLGCRSPKLFERFFIVLIDQLDEHRGLGLAPDHGQCG